MRLWIIAFTGLDQLHMAAAKSQINNGRFENPHVKTDDLYRMKRKREPDSEN